MNDAPVIQITNTPPIRVDLCDSDRLKLAVQTSVIKVTLSCGSSGSGGGRTIKTGLVSGSSFSGTPKIFDVVFATPYPDLNYCITIAGTDARNYTYQSKATTGFTINANASQSIAGEVSWITMVTGET